MHLTEVKIYFTPIYPDTAPAIDRTEPETHSASTFTSAIALGKI